MSYNIDNDPLAEPKSTGFAPVVPEGLQPGEIVRWDVDTKFVSKKNNPGWKFEIDALFKQYAVGSELDAATVRYWMDTSSNFGKLQVHDMLLNMGVPHETPDTTALSVATGQPRKSFLKSLADIDDITGEIHIKLEGLLGRKAIFQVQHKKRCQGCKWMHPKNVMECPNCREDLTKAFLYAAIDTTMILPIGSIPEATEVREVEVRQEPSTTTTPTTTEPQMTAEQKEHEKGGGPDDLPF